jgi:glutamine amidotransferase
MWADRRFREVVPLLRTAALVAAARNASPGSPVEETGNAPFTSGRWLFSHNGFVEGYRNGLDVAMRREVSDRRAAGILGAADSEVVFALLLDRLDAGEPPEDAVASMTVALAARAGGRLNFLLGDGGSMVATAWGNSLFVRQDDAGVVIASEPLDADSEWKPVPDRSLVVARRTTGDDPPTLTTQSLS